MPPFLSYVTFNRLGLTARNIKALLATPEDFEMHIIDSNSKDDTWEFIQALNDSRIKSKTRLPLNAGPIYAINLNLSRRREDQYFITLDSDVCIHTSDWISKFMEVFNMFPEVGLLGVMRGRPYSPVYSEVIPKSKDGVCYLEIKYGNTDIAWDFVHGCCQILRPELIKQIGYWSEENGWGDAELTPRVNNYTNFKAGYMSNADFESLIDIDMTQFIECAKCEAKDYCKLDKNTLTCFDIQNKLHKNESFVEKFQWKFKQTFRELAEGKRSAYCASIFDPTSLENHLYYKDWALENFNHYIKNSN